MTLIFNALKHCAAKHYQSDKHKLTRFYFQLLRSSHLHEREVLHLGAFTQPASEKWV